MAFNDIFKRSPKRPYTEVSYIFGMILIILGVGSAIVSIDPRPLSRSSWLIFLLVGLFLIGSGTLLLFSLSRIKLYPIISPIGINENDTINSAADLLNANLYNDMDETSHAAYQNTVESLESVKAVSQCMMTKSENSKSIKSILFYKETFV